MAAPQAQLRVSRYFAVLAVIIAVLYALVFLTGEGSIADRAKPKLGLDLQGGKTVTLQAATADGKAPKREDMETARGILRARIDDKGVSEPEVLIDGDRNIVINVPGAGASDLSKVSAPAKMRFREVLQEAPDSGAAAPPAPTPSPSTSPAPSGSPSPKPSASPSGAKAGSGGGGMALAPTPSPSAPAAPSAAPSPAPSAAPPKTEDDEGNVVKQEDVLKKLGPEILQKVQGAQSAEELLTPEAEKLLAPIGKLSGPEIAVLPIEFQLRVPQVTCALLAKRPVGSIENKDQQGVACEKDGHMKMLLDKSTVLGEDIKTASYEFDTQAGGWKVNLSFQGKGQEAWTNLTKKTVNKRVAVVLDNTILSAPTINQVISGPAEITGQFTQEDASDLASQLKFGALPLSFEVSAADDVSATLGLQSLKYGLLAGGIGLILVVIYSLIYYRALGLVTILSLVASAAVIYASIVLLGRQIGFTLTLAGVAGFIVAVGITADSFVVFFERLKDEVKDGRSVRTAVPRAWVRARRTILSADSVSFLAAATLYIFAIGAVQGFAFTLGLSTVVDVLIVFLFTHPLVALVARSKTFTSPRISGLGNMRDAAPAPVAAGRVSTKES